MRLMEPVNVGLEKILVKSLRQAAAEDAPMLAWPLVCGARVSKRTRPLGYADGILRVEVPDAGWRAELQSMAGQYLAIINRYVGHRVSRIEFVIAQPIQ